ncbi:MAG TPA: flagellar hook protein FlgE [Rhodocyclaceae bacterium]|jgi:flagellar hook protein FlgE|nr:flagellar hook protein FlgE [Rhodocyclaceae bacterium]
MSFQQGLSGLNVSSNALNTIGNNIANSGTVGFKGANAQFSDIYAASLNGTGASQIGIGANMSSVFQQFTQGNLTTTGNPLDLAINGGGFYRLSDASGTSAGNASYTRNGQFLINKDGYIVNSAGLYLTGLQADPATGIVPDSGQPGGIKLDTSLIDPNATTTSEIGLNLDSRKGVPANAPFDPTDPLSYTSSTTQTVYDSLGNPHNFQMYFVKSATANTWSMYTQLDGDSTTLNDPTVNAAATGPITLNFNASGALTGTPAMPLTLWPATGYPLATTTGAANLTFTVDLQGSTQYGQDFGVNALNQDGYTSGRLSGVAVSSDGTIQGQYSNGRTRDMGRLVLATFQNPNGLQNVGGNLWRETADSGQPIVGAPGQGNLGVIQSSTVEDSNVDLTAELVDMIVQQRAYQANAQTIKTQDQILQTLVNLR